MTASLARAHDVRCCHFRRMPGARVRPGARRALGRHEQHEPAAVQEPAESPLLLGQIGRQDLGEQVVVRRDAGSPGVRIAGGPLRGDLRDLIDVGGREQRRQLRLRGGVQHPQRTGLVLRFRTRVLGDVGGPSVLHQHQPAADADQAMQVELRPYPQGRERLGPDEDHTRADQVLAAGRTQQRRRDDVRPRQLHPVRAGQDDLLDVGVVGDPVEHGPAVLGQPVSHRIDGEHPPVGVLGRFLVGLHEGGALEHRRHPDRTAIVALEREAAVESVGGRRPDQVRLDGSDVGFGDQCEQPLLPASSGRGHRGVRHSAGAGRAAGTARARSARRRARRSAHPRDATSSRTSTARARGRAAAGPGRPPTAASPFPSRGLGRGAPGRPGRRPPPPGQP